MPADLDITDGVASFASFREIAWHGLGEVFTDEVTSINVMLEKAHLANWNVRYADPLVDGIPDARFIAPTRHVVRTNPIDGGIDVLGTVGGRYTIVQNERAFDFLASLADGARWETAGALDGGRTVFGSIALDREIVLDPSGVADVVKVYLLVTTRHDGSGSVEIRRTPVRVVCANTLGVATSGNPAEVKVRHSAKAEEKMLIAAETWRDANTYFDEFETEARALYETPATDAQFVEVVRSLYPAPTADASKSAVTRDEKRMETLSQAWKMDANAGIRGTAWGVFNAITEYNQWARQIQKNTESGNENFFAAGAGFDNATNAFRQKAYAATKALIPA